MLKRKASQTPQVQIINDDCLVAMKDIADGSVNLVFSSPPYNIGKEYEDSAGLDAYLAFHARVIEQICRVVSHDGVICWQVGNYVRNGVIRPLDLEFEPLFMQHGFALHRRFVWTFGHGLHGTKRFSGRYETIAVFSRVSLVEQLTSSSLIEKEWVSGIIDSAPNVKSNHVEKVDHPCQFPIELVERFVLKYSSVGDTVLDPFAGVCTTGIAAKLHGRVSICVEIDEDYVESGRARLAKLDSGILKRRALGTAIHVPSSTDSVARRPAHFDDAENLSLAAETDFRGAVDIRQWHAVDDGSVDLLFVSAAELPDISLAIVRSCRSVCVVVRAAECEAAAYRDCILRFNMKMLNRIVGTGQSYVALLWFVRDTQDYHFDLDAVRVPAKYPGKRSVSTGEFSGNPLGKNPSDVWSHCAHAPSTCSTTTLFALLPCVCRAVIRAFVPLGGFVLVRPVHERHADFVINLKRNVRLLKD